MAVFCHYLESRMANYGSETSFLLIFIAKDDLAKVSWKLDARKCQNQVTPPYFDQLSERGQPLSNVTKVMYYLISLCFIHPT